MENIKIVDNIPWGEKLAVFIKFKKGDPSDLRPQDDREDERMLTITLFVILSEAKNLMFLLNFSPDVF
jgi:hypothetical protein